ncbi:PH domain-containing protein, partial [Thermodesulfobacteriota bacterium]
MAKPKISAKHLVADIKAGSTLADLAAIHSISTDKLRRVIQLLKDKGHIDQAQVDRLIPKRKDPINDKADALIAEIDAMWICPACIVPQDKPFEECPQCGVIVSKFQQKQAREKEQAAREQRFQQAIAGSYIGQSVPRRYVWTVVREVLAPHERFLGAFYCNTEKSRTPVYLLVTDKRIIWRAKNAPSNSDALDFQAILSVTEKPGLITGDVIINTRSGDIRSSVLVQRELDRRLIFLDSLG